MKRGTRIPAANTLCLILASLSVPTASFAVSPLSLSGSLSGSVRDVVGKPQMGAIVFLYDHRDKLCERVLTDAQGQFNFGGLIPDFYSVHVTMASFLPAVRDRIQIQPGIRRLLEVNLSTLFSSIQLVAPEPGQSALMNDDWKWVLRSSGSMRPVVRLLPASRPIQQHAPAIFSETRGLVRVSGGDSSGSENEADLGTVFAVATSLYGSNQLQLSGNVGYVSASGLPSAGFRTVFSRTMGSSTPQISVTMRQLSVPGRVNSAISNIPGLDGGPHLRSMSVSLSDKTEISDDLELEYGMELDSISYLSRLHYLSPYAKLTYSLPSAKIDFAYTSGNARPELGANRTAENADLEQDVAALSRMARVSLLDGRAKVQRGKEYELGISRSVGSRDYRAAVYHESVTNAAVTAAVPGHSGDLFNRDFLPDLFSDTSVFNAGDFQTIGYLASVSQKLGDNYRVTVIYSSGGVLVPHGSGPIENHEELRGLIHAARRDAVTTQASGIAPVTGTHFMASYQWAGFRAATSAHLYTTESTHPDPGLNISIRQPIPGALGRPAHIEATAELRNMLAQGYLPFTLTNGRRLLLMETPRSFRGGLSFTF